MRFVGLALISALAASGATWGCENAQPLPPPGAGETPIPASAADHVIAPANNSPANNSPANNSPANSAAGAETAPAPIPGAAGLAAAENGTPEGVATSGSSDPKGNDGRLAAGDQRLTGEDRLLQDPLIGDTLIGDGEPMDDVDDAASGVAEPDPDQAGAPDEPPTFPRLAPPSTVPPAVPPTLAVGAGQAEPRGTASENQQR